MQENEVIDPDYIKGFNEGYIIKKHLPELAEKLASAIDKSEHGVGFQDGKNQYDLEQQKDRYPAWIRDDRLSNLNNEPDKAKEKSKDDLELEK